MVKRWTDRMAGVKYASRPYKPVTVLEYVEFFRLWFYTTHQKKGAVANKLGIGNKKLNRILTLEQFPDEELLKEMMKLCNVK
nr:MAG TPA: helix-turn-helix domain protein [Caudoviricetes sp.]